MGTKEKTTEGPNSVSFETDSCSIAFTEVGGGMVAIQSPSYSREALVLRKMDVLTLHSMLAKVIGRA